MGTVTTLPDNANSDFRNFPNSVLSHALSCSRCKKTIGASNIEQLWHSAIVQCNNQGGFIMTNSCGGPRRFSDICKDVNEIAARLETCQEGVIMKKASEALKKGEIERASRLIMECLSSPNLYQGEKKLLELDLEMLKPTRRMYVRSVTMGALSWLSRVSPDTWINFLTIALECVHDSLSVYSNKNDSTYIHSLSTGNRFGIRICSRIAIFCTKIQWDVSVV